MFGINKFWLWLIALGLSFAYQPTWAIIIWMVGILFFFLWIFFGGPKQFQLKEGTWVKEVRQENGMTTIIITDGKEDIVQQFTSNRVSVADNIITVGTKYFTINKQYQAENNRTAYLLGKKKVKDESKNFTIKSEKNDNIGGYQPNDNPAPNPRPSVQEVEDESVQFIDKTKEPTPSKSITKEITTKRGQGEVNKLISDMRFEGYQTLYFPADGYNSRIDYLTPIKDNPDQNFAVIIDEVQRNPEAVKEAQEALALFDTDRVRLYTVVVEA